MFLRNYWYVAASSHEVGEQPLGRMILGEPVVLYRRPDGAPVALEDRCCHRRVPLSLGKVVGDRLQCGYHGLEFDPTGACVRIPAQTQIPSRARVRTYPVIERYRWLWVWMGDPALADPDKITDFHWLDDPDWGAKGAMFPVKCNYQLVVDNLLDLTHLTYVHGKTIGNAAATEGAEISVEQGPDFVRVTRWIMDAPAPPTYVRMGGFTGNIDRWQIITFTPPCFVRLDVGGAPAGNGARQGNRQGGITMWNLNAITPETPTSVHYFWGQAHDFTPRDAAVTERVFQEIYATFEEDVGILAAQQRMYDLDPESPIIDIRVDHGPLMARRLIDRLLTQEGGDPQPAAAE